MLTTLVLALAGTPPALPAEGETYRSVVARSLQTAQQAVYASLDFEVDHSRWEDPWIVTTANYEVRTTHSYLQARRIADGLETMHGEFVRVLGQPVVPRQRRKPVWIFPTISDYNSFGDSNGAEHSSMLGSFYASGHADRPVVTYEVENQILLGMWVTHSALHQFLEEGFGPQRMVWVDEGLASYFALAWDRGYGADQLEFIQSSRKFIPLGRLIEEPLQAYTRDPNTRFIELGMLMDFLLNKCEATRNGATGDPTTGPFQEFLRAAVRGQDVSETEFFQTFEDAADLLEQDFKDFDFRG